MSALAEETRPTTKTRSPIRVVPYMVAGGPSCAVEYDVLIPGRAGGRPQLLTNRIPCSEPKPGLWIEPMEAFAWQIKGLVEDFATVQARIDTLVRERDEARQAADMATRDVQKLNNQLADARRKLEAKNGKKE